MQVGTTKDHGLYNTPSAAMHLGALVAGTLLHVQYKRVNVPLSQMTDINLQIFWNIFQ